MRNKISVFGVFFLSLILVVYGYPTGAPETACGDMVPGHGVDFQTSISPYTLSATCTGSSCQVTIEGSANFLGFMLKALDSNEAAVGKFTLIADRTHLICNGSAVTHSERLYVNQIINSWTVNDFRGDIHFKATVVKDRTTFWRVTSQIKNVMPIGTPAPSSTTPSTNAPSATVPSPTTPSTTALSATAHSPNTPSPNTPSPTIHSTSTAVTAPSPLPNIVIQKTCSSKKGCYQFPDKNCVVTWSKGKDNYVFFQVSAIVVNDNRYIAIAFSYDDKTGNDSVVLCWKSGDSFKVNVWYNDGKTVVHVPDSQQSLDPSKTVGLYSIGWMSCKFSKQIKKDANASSDKVFYIDGTLYYLLFATGLMEAEPDRRSSSDTMFNFTDFAPVQATRLEILKSCPPNGSCFRCADGFCIITWTQGKTNYVDFQISAKVDAESNYVAMAFSLDDKMGDDSVVICWKSGYVYKAESWYTAGRGVARVTNPQESLDTNSTQGIYLGGWTSCNFSKQITKDAKVVKRAADLVYYLGDRQYYLLFATGPMQGDQPQQHTRRIQSSEPFDFTNFNVSATGQSSPSNSLIKAHGILMVLAWLVSASMAMLLPRYFKSTWPDTKIMKKPLWFIFHQAIMVFVLTLTAIAFIIIFCEAGGYAICTDPIAQAHPPLGITVMILVVLNPVMALFRCDGDHKNRWVFNYFHSFVGEFAIVIAVITIFLAFYIPEANIGSWVKWVMVALICWHVFIEMLLFMHEKYLQSRSQQNEQDSSRVGFRSLSTRASAIKTVLLLFQWIGVTGLAIAICVGIGIA